VTASLGRASQSQAPRPGTGGCGRRPRRSELDLAGIMFGPSRRLVTVQVPRLFTPCLDRVPVPSRCVTCGPGTGAVAVSLPGSTGCQRGLGRYIHTLCAAGGLFVSLIGGDSFQNVFSRFHHRYRSMLGANTTAPAMNFSPRHIASDDGASTVDDDDDEKFQFNFVGGGENGQGLDESGWAFGNDETARGTALPVDISPDALLGSMPKTENARKEGLLRRLTSKQEWRGMRVVLTEQALYFSKPNEDVLRDMIPLLEILKIRMPRHLPPAHATFDGFCITSANAENGSCHSEEHAAADAASSRTMLHIQTAEGGYNSGRSYFLSANSPQEREEWASAIRSARRASALRASPSAIRAIQSSLRAFYHGVAFQTLIAALIFACFLANVVQLEYQANSTRYTALEQVPSMRESEQAKE
jgi:hypothetical protein